MRNGYDKHLLLALGAAVLFVALLQTSIVPVLAAVTHQLGISSVAGSWAITANLLAAAAATPLFGRLADIYNKKFVLLGVLGLVVAGSLLAATFASLPALIAGRVLQGASFAVMPVAVSILRAELPPERMLRAISALSAILGFGGALGLVVTGFLMPPGAGYQRVFWLFTAVAVVVVVAAAMVVPSRPGVGGTRVDWAGAAALAAGLCMVMLAISQGSLWGWVSLRTVAVAAAGATILVQWWRRSARMNAPLVSTRMLRHRPVLLANAATFLVGMGLYLMFLGITDFVERGQDGFGAGILAASIQFLVPGAIAAAVMGMISGRCIERFGARAVAVAGGLAGVAGFVLLTGWHAARWEVVVAALLTNAYISLGYSVLPAMIIAEVDTEQTAVATSLNAVCRKVGSATAAALVAALLTPVAGGRIPQSGFTAVFILGALTAGGVVLLAMRTVKAPEQASRIRRLRPATRGQRGPRTAGSVALQGV